jgi:hypothetical protein
MTKEFQIDRYYSKGKYEAVIGTIVVGCIFFIVAIYSLFLIQFDQTDPFVSLETWGYWMFIPAFFILLGGVQQYYTNLNYKKSVTNAIMERHNQGTYKLEEIALEVGIKPNDVLKVLLDLRNQGKINYRFNASSGEIMLGENIAYSRSENFIPPPKKLQEPLKAKGKNYCIYCGHKVEPEAIFCENCGSKLT